MSSENIDDAARQLAAVSVEESITLSFAGRSLKLDSENDANEIVDALHNSKTVNVFELKGNTLGIAAAKVLGNELAHHPELKRALWSDLFTGRLKTEIPDALKHLCSGLMTAGAQLVELDLSDNAFGPNGMTGLTEFLSSSSCFTLRELRLNNNGLGIQGGKMLAESLRKCYAASVTAGQPLALRVFVSGRGRLEDEGATALAEAFKEIKTLEEVHMPQNGINHRGISALADAFAVNPQLRIVNLSDNTFTHKGSHAMAKTLSSLEHVEVLNFDDCLVRSRGAVLLAKSLAAGVSQLKVLKLSGNEIGLKAAEAVIQSLSNKSQLMELDLNCNQLGSAGVKRVRQLLSDVDKLKQLSSLSDDEGTEEEDEDDDDDDDDDDDHDDDSDDGDNNGVADDNSVVTQPQSTVDDFLNSPSTATFQQLGRNSRQLFSDYISGRICRTDEVLAVYFKIARAMDTDEQLRCNVLECADEVLSQAFKNAESNASLSVLSNLLMTHLGLIKSEDKSFRPVVVSDSVITCLQHAVQQSYFPLSTKDILRFFITQSKEKLDNADMWTLWQRVLSQLPTPSA